MVQASFIGTVTVDAWIIWASILAYAGAVSYMAYAGIRRQRRTARSSALATRSTDLRLLQPRSLDDVGAMTYRLKELLETSAAAQRELRAGEARLRMFAEAASDYFFELDADLRFSFFSDRFREITGLDPSILIGRSALEMGDEYRFEFDSDRPANLVAHRPYRDFRFTVRDRTGRAAASAIERRAVFRRSRDGFAAIVVPARTSPRWSRRSARCASTRPNSRRRRRWKRSAS